MITLTKSEPESWDTAFSFSNMTTCGSTLTAVLFRDVEDYLNALIPDD